MSMRHRIAALGGLAMLTALIVPLTSATAAPAGTATITATVKDSDGSRLAGVKVQVIESDVDDGHTVATRTSDARGRISVEGVKVTSFPYYLYAHDPTGRHQDRYSTTFQLKAGQTVRRTVTMKPAAIITGRLVEKDGDAVTPAAGAIVSAEGDGDHGDAVVRKNGSFRIGGLAGGTYTVSFQDADSEYAMECYDEKPFDEERACADATRVTVKAGTTKTVKRQTLNHRLAEMSGTLTEADGETPLADATITVYGSDGVEAYGTTTGENGFWTVKGITRGDQYRIRAVDGATGRTTWYDGADSFDDATPIRVKAGGAVDDINIAMPDRDTPGTSTMQGGVYEGSTGIPISAVVTVYGPDGQPVASTRTDAHGYWSFEDLEDGVEYRVEAVADSADFGTQWYRFASSFETADPVVLGPGGSDIEEVPIEMERR